ncbi:DNA polymerase III subunit gamma/tau [Vagococcus sp. BWB3-3]|uniref:DNA-directed DNA polymerase n=1 Tax=Vagococcus allomyrinae TaxID=2794353 RepID=A0A940PBT0_9ENTE|nr:DNA polymerase III subunit gamma/tau [Vagococcus allomyrinae]MBP1042084.1 DNA polymerase III subunit gamma/tau [Vagococcus allomyrinae]
MTYQALYRVWRSQRFDTIVGQQTVTQTLKNAIVQNKTSHAYLFTGPRGTGKTSAAKIFAKAINCRHSQDGEPCNECETCQAITEGRLNDVIEIDAASNNGVEEIRDIREKVKYAPTQADYKVYIIDEVHMLSTGAFNALLKTLEEPPKNVLFILATTEPHKIPLTIISRTQRFDFKRISTQDIVDHMAEILQSMEIDYDEQSLFVVARAAEGGMRDALSILDQALSFGDERLTVDDALQVTGSLTFEMMDTFIQYCTDGKTEEGLVVLNKLLNEGKEGSRFLEDLLLYCRDLLMYKQAPRLLANQSGQLTEGFKELGDNLLPETIYQYIQILSDTQHEIRFTNHPNIYLEVATVKLATLRKPKSLPVTSNEGAVAIDSAELSDLKQEVERLSADLAALKKEGPVKEAPAQKAAPKKSTYRLPTERVYQVLREATRDQLQQIQDAWEEVLQLLTVTQRAMLKASEPVAASGTGLVLSFDYEIVCQRASEDTELQENVRTGFNRILQYQPNLICIPKESWTGLRRDFLSQHQDEMVANSTNDALPMGEVELVPPEEDENTVVNEAVELFGERVVEVVND